jgi:hypothetical protein
LRTVAQPAPQTQQQHIPSIPHHARRDRQTMSFRDPLSVLQEKAA